MLKVNEKNFKKVLRSKIVGRIVDCERFNKESVLLIEIEGKLKVKELNKYLFKVEDEYSEYCVGVELFKRKKLSGERDRVYYINIINYN